MCEEDIFEGLLQELVYCAASGHTDKWEENDWREWLRPQVEKVYQKSSMLDDVQGKLQKLSEDIWGVMAKSDTHNANLFAIYTRLNDTIESIKTHEKRPEETQ